MKHISIIIPTLNEAENIGALLSHLITVSTDYVLEIIVVDGGSTDRTLAIVKDVKESTNKLVIKLINSPKGRAKQMNLGASQALGDVLYFLHADTFPPTQFDNLIMQKIAAQEWAGCFRMKFDSSHWWLRLAGWLTRFNHKACRGGDQSLFITTTLFNELQGFNEKFTIYEDQEFINRLYKRNEFTVIPEWITTSSRRYDSNGIWKLQYHFWTIYFKKFFGASADDLHAYYIKNIKE